MLSDRKSLIILFAILVISLALFILVLTRLSYKPSQGSLKPSSGVKVEETTEDVDISHFFEDKAADGEGQTFISPIPMKGKKVDCVLGGLKMQEGTVASDTVCVNQP